MELVDLFAPDAIVVGIAPTTRKAAFQALAQIMTPGLSIAPERIVQALNEREKLGSTGFGGGIAIPHGRVPELTHMAGGLAILAEPIGWDALDGRPVDILFALLAPEDAGAEHLKTLARVSRTLRDARVVAQLRGARDAAAVRAILAAGSEREAA
ncbi:MAG: PTS sugar transporter subunit IIA [Sphingomonadaceae bacterium]